MIVPSMTNLEVYNELAADLPKLKIRANTLMAKVVKEFRKVRRFPAWQCYEYTHQESKNKYLISFYAGSAKQFDNPEVDYIGLAYDADGRVVIKWDEWCFSEDLTKGYCFVKSIGYFRGHFFSRYRERVWPNESINPDELVCRFFTRNKRAIPIQLNDEIKQGYERYGLFQYGMDVPDGICLMDQYYEGGDLSMTEDNSNKVYVVIYRTIISKYLLSKGQAEAIKQEGNEYVRDHYWEPIRKAYVKRLQNLPDHLLPPFLNKTQ